MSCTTLSVINVSGQLFIRTNIFVCLEKFDNNIFSKKTSVFEALRLTVTCSEEIGVMSLTVRLEEGSNVYLQVNSPHLKKPKNATMQAVINVKSICLLKRTLAKW